MGASTPVLPAGPVGVAQAATRAAVASKLQEVRRRMGEAGVEAGGD
ncbi:hypothetical protein GCM10009107_01570 [Ideonella azotifigens]|uniref:Uncharacterized protein n=1 Tax=Ideonella azotifigens TaxID=513160 RepID=A0ABN1JI71_9BURK